jgi:nicotinate-nucleotide adenylyltransferase
VEELRALAYTDLDKAMLTGIEETIEDMQTRGNPIHRNTKEAQAWFRDRGVTLTKEA